ncbi:monoamine oxidase [Jannaschia faecimaris]|uniref:Monoamine oxidase n=1 Tax=Jannaschia faecimaris TaxID=1244108 RepID=A0A1H3TCM5_9RHOB|nr:FAD-dependent oxidoreductase [Jannaschia faecimaris]SDZ47628.1 monoamine oxidase [Jannaschia faecimaris]
MSDTDVLIVGGGLSGLALADRLQAAGQDWQLIEARSRLGGRIDVLRHGGTAFDMGPSWFWPGQPRMAAMADRLGLHVFSQHADGALIWEDESGGVQRDRGFSSMAGSLRIAGGMAAMIDGLATGLPSVRLHLGSAVAEVRPDGVTLSDGCRIGARRIVMALPPRVVAELAFSPLLEPEILSELRAVPTWMGGQAKFVAVYDRPFWRDTGLSGDGMSRRGPLVEIHDASGPTGTPGALFGFVGVPATHRAGQGAAIRQAATAQLARMFGTRIPVATQLTDWADHPETASALDRQPLYAHPDYRMPAALAQLWDGALMLGSTEVAPEHGGFLEGALAMADHLSVRLN